ncbi:MAG: hypothetical protein GY792_26210 [Gammaproteobacteria bacterium]|nr:hypothetical protein [Gammaproteobacteria bacterium]
MKKVDADSADELRPEYKRSDFGELVRGKYADALAEESNVVVLDPEVARAFPNDKAVNEALLGLLRIAKMAGLKG